MYATSPTDTLTRQGTGGGTATTRPPAPSRRTATPAPRGEADTGSATGTGAGPVEDTWHLDHRPEAAAEARRIARRTVADWTASPDCHDAALLVVSELVTNAVEHAKAPVHLHLHRALTDNSLWIGVSDGGPAPRDGLRTRIRIPDEHGRGLALVHELAQEHGTRTWAGGHATHWARINPTA